MSNKTLKINPELFKFDKRDKQEKRDKKMKTNKNTYITKQNKSANKIKRELLQRVKNYQKTQESEKSKPETNNHGLNIYNYNNSESLESNFDDEFNKSLGFLQSIYSKNKDKKTKNKQVNKSPVNIGLSSELKNTNLTNHHASTSKTPLYGCLKTGTLPLNSQKTMKIPNRHVTIQLNNNNSLETEKHNLESLDTKQLQTDISFLDDIPQILDVAIEPVITKPIETQELPVNLDLPEKKISIEPINFDKEIITTRLENLDSIQLLKPSNNNNNNNNTIKVKELPKITRTTRNFTYKLGKKNGRVGILIKNRNKIKDINQTTALLKQKTIAEIKDYLRQHNLIKLGTQAPNDVLRKMYESSILSGDINNTGENVIYNYINQ
tara:strand:+ start:25826 stop:26965 length:1140 start_codon:yes stop_codon:yes gene_type:complete